jgi:hypothetical protein
MKANIGGDWTPRELAVADEAADLLERDPSLRHQRDEGVPR